MTAAFALGPSAIAGSTDASDGYYDIDCTYAKSTSGRNTLQQAAWVRRQGGRSDALGAHPTGLVAHGALGEPTFSRRAGVSSDGFRMAASTSNFSSHSGMLTSGGVMGEWDKYAAYGIPLGMPARNTDSTGGDEFTLTYDGVGNLTDDGQAYEYVYDVFGRLCTVKNTSNQATIASYRYNALNQRIMFHEDTEPDGDVDASDPKYYLIYDERWRHIATYRADDDNPKELFVYHQAGLDGSGGSSYIDSVILRQRDANSGWASAADGTLEERRYYCQNWRADVSAIITSGGLIVEWAKYTAYGIPFGLPGGDTDSDGDCDSTDITQIQTWIDAPAYDVRGDINLDGSVNATDKSLAISNYQGTTSGWNVLSAAVVASRIGYAGYQKDINLDISHVRHRVLEPHLGRWTRRDPLGYVDGMGLYAYAGGSAIVRQDSTGLAWRVGSPYAEPPAFTVPLACLGTGSFSACYGCCIDLGYNESYCITVCMDRYPYIPPYPGGPLAPTPKHSACARACSSGLDDGVNTCFAGQPIACVCPFRNVPGFPEPLPDEVEHTYRCIALQELLISPGLRTPNTIAV